MSNAYMDQFMYSYTRGLVSINGSIAVATSTTGVTATSGRGFSAARTNTGEITITLTDKYQALVGADFTVLSATAQDRVVQIVSQDVSGAKTVVIKLLAGATATDPAGSALTIYVNLYLRNSTVSL